MFSTRGIPIRSFLRFSINAIRCFAGLRPGSRRNWISHALWVRRPEHLARGHIYKVGVRVFDLIQTRFDVLHLADIFHRAFFTSCNDEPLLALQKQPGNFLDRNKILRYLSRLM